MKIFITKGMDGRSIKTIDSNCQTTEDAFKKIYAWKDSEKNNGKYRICHYDRMIFNDKKHRIIVDFGDYSYFICVKCTKTEWADVEAWHSRPIDLEV